MSYVCNNSNNTSKDTCTGGDDFINEIVAGGVNNVTALTNSDPNVSNARNNDDFNKINEVKIESGSFNKAYKNKGKIKRKKRNKDKNKSKDTPKKSSPNDSFRMRRSDLKQRVKTVVKAFMPNMRHSKIDKKNLSYLVCNIRGYSSKKATMHDILSASEIDIVLMSETHLYNGKKPSHPNYKFIGRSRDKVNSKGGVAIGFKNELKDQMVKVREGQGKNEFILVKCTAVEPPIIFGVVYGLQENTTPENEIRDNLAELFAAIDEYKEQGCKILIGGDLNVHVGEHIPGNDNKTSKGGKLLVELCQDFGVEIINKYINGNKMTHFDASGGTARVLDYVISDLIEEHVNIEIDHELNMTPYVPRLKRDKNGERKWMNNYTDHRSIIGEVSVTLRPDKVKQKIKQWRMNRPGGKDKYRELTDMNAERALSIILENECTEKMFNELQKLINEIKDKAYGIRTTTKKRAERQTDQNILLKRSLDIKDAIEKMDLDGKKINEKIFLSRKQFNSNDDDEIIQAMDHYKTGERLENPDDITESILDYNAEVLTKNDNISMEYKMRREERKEAVDFFKLIEDNQSEEPITWGEYLIVVKNVMQINKGCYKDFTLAGPKWKTAMYTMFQKIYLSEQIPETFKQTKLKKLYKKKGDVNKLTSYRFIHLRDWAGKMMEKLILEKCHKVIERTTPEMQIGGKKLSSTIEHITTVLTRAKMAENEKKCLIIELLDIVKCFDRCLLSDTLYDAAVESGVTGKQLRMIEAMHEDTRISLAGDKQGRERLIKNSIGQGTNWAPEGCSNSIALSTEQAIKAVNHEIQIGGTNRGTIIFVDDTLRMATDTNMARSGGVVFTESLNNLSLEAHPDKSRIVVMGPKKMRDEIKKELEKDPVKIQGWDMKTSALETYLGFQLDEKGVRECKNKSIEGRVRGARAKSIQLLKVLEDDKIMKIGWLESAKLLFTSIIIPTLTYGAQAYTNMTKKQKEMLEASMRENLYRMLNISRTSHYSSVLLEMNLIPINNIIDQLKISFVNSLIHEKGSGVCLDTIKEEERKYPGTGMIGEVKRLCEIYKLPDVTKYRVKKERIKEYVWEKARQELWRNAMRNRRVPITTKVAKHKKLYWTLPKYEARLILSHNIGELNFKDNKRRESRQKFGNLRCFAGCEENDSLEHVKQCERYDTKFRNFYIDGTDEKYVRYLRALDIERWRKYQHPLTFRPNRKQRERNRGVAK